MPEDVGSMKVTYSVAVDQAIRNLDKYDASIKKNENTFKKQSKTESDGMKKSSGMMKKMSVGMVAAATTVAAAFAVVVAAVALVVTGIYGIIKASSYGAIYTKQFGAATQQIANLIMEDTGLNNVMADLTRAYQTFADAISEVGWIAAILGALAALNEWIANHILTPFRDAGAAVGRFFQTLKEKGAWEAIKGLILEFSGWIWDKVIWLFPNASQAFVDFINKLRETDWVQLAKDTFGKIYDWIKTNILDVAYSWGETVGTKLKEGINSLIDTVKAIIPDNIKSAIKTLIDKAYQFGVDIANKIKAGLKSVVLSVTVSVKKIISSAFGFGGEGGGGTSISPGSMPGGGSYNDVVISPSGKVITTNPKDFLIATKNPGELMGNGDTYNIAPVINITTSGGSGMAGDISRQVSKAIADEIRRITKV